MMEIEYFNESHYPMVCKWWADWGFPCLPLESLPAIGMIAKKNGKPVYAGWIYKTDSDMCWLEWFVGDKKASKEERQGALQFLINEMSKKAKLMGFNFAFASVVNQSLISKLKRQGFIPETNYTNLTKNLKWVQ